jgi:hypothetical protein
MATFAISTSILFLLFLPGQKGPLIPVIIDMNRQTEPLLRLLKNFVYEVEIIWGRRKQRQITISIVYEL